MNPNSPFGISQFTNPSGQIVFRLSGWLDGKRVRKNFKTRAEAEASRQVFDIGRLQATAGIRAALTRLPDEQIQEAEAAFRRLAQTKHTLLACVDFTLANYRAPETQKPLAAAVAEYIASKEHELNQKHISVAQFYRIRCDLKTLLRGLAGRTVAELTAPTLITLLERGMPAIKTYNNRRGILSTFLKFAYQRGWIIENPILRIPHHRIRKHRGLAKTLSTDQARLLMEHFETFEGGRWVPYYALCLFAGIRPGVPYGEITKLQKESINLEAGTIFISSEVSKVREPRKITIQPNLASWLRAYPLDRFKIVVGDFQARRAKFAKQFGLTHDVLRHTYISMFVAKYRSIGEAAIQAGNSESIIRRHYLDPKETSEAEQFFAITPKRTAPLTAFPLRAQRFRNIPASIPDGLQVTSNATSHHPLQLTGS